jgi:hypothetical protein
MNFKEQCALIDEAIQSLERYYEKLEKEVSK